MPAGKVFEAAIVHESWRTARNSIQHAQLACARARLLRARAARSIARARDLRSAGQPGRAMAGKPELYLVGAPSREAQRGTARSQETRSTA